MNGFCFIERAIVNTTCGAWYELSMDVLQVYPASYHLDVYTLAELAWMSLLHDHEKLCAAFRWEAGNHATSHDNMDVK